MGRVPTICDTTNSSQVGTGDKVYEIISTLSIAFYDSKLGIMSLGLQFNTEIELCILK